jgi:hypothetical protein
MMNAQSTSFVSRFCRGIADRRTTLSGVFALGLMQCAAIAQDSPLRPPKVTEGTNAPKIIVYLVLVLLIAGVIFAASMKCKRSHLD